MIRFVVAALLAAACGGRIDDQSVDAAVDAKKGREADGGGEACDTDTAQVDFQCHPPPPANTTDLCQPCDDQATACKPGSTCLPLNGAPSSCAKFCCDDGDCGSGHCDKSRLQTQVVGVCVK